MSVKNTLMSECISVNCKIVVFDWSNSENNDLMLCRFSKVMRVTFSCPGDGSPGMVG